MLRNSNYSICSYLFDLYVLPIFIEFTAIAGIPLTKPGEVCVLSPTYAIETYSYTI